MQIPPLAAGASRSAPHGPAAGEDLVPEIERLLRGPTPRWSEKKILRALRQADPDQLNDALSRLNLRWLLRDVDNHCLGPQHHTELVKLLSQERVAELTVPVKARLIDALMRGRSRSLEEKAILALFLTTEGRALRDLKNLVDAGNDHYDLQTLIYHDMDDRSMRARLTDHFHTQSHRVSDRQLKVLSDIDDTFYANYKDARYPRGTVYPGVRQFYAELDLAPAGDLTFLTARPNDSMGVIKDRTHRSLAKRGVQQKVVVAGTLGSLLSNPKIAAKKLQNFSQYRHIFPEYDFVFTGDSGQGDVLVAEKMIGPEVRGRFIHDVVATPPAVREQYRQQGIHFFDTYVGAALAAQGQGLLGLEACRRVALAAAEDFGVTAFANEPQRQARRSELQSDLDRLNARLAPDQQVALPTLRPLEEFKLPTPPSDRNY